MKMSDEFTIPTNVRDSKITADEKFKAQFAGRSVTAPNEARTTHIQDKLITIAVNNHDALVDALNNLISAHDVYDDYGHCRSCGESKHKNGCDYIGAVNLLDKIKWEDLK